MKIVKGSEGGTPAVLTPGELSDINRLSRKELTAQEVYTFSVRLCDNEVDRDGERFAPHTLEELAPLFLGKSGIFDHQWSARGQAARIYKTEVVREPEKMTRAGDGYCWLKGSAYMVRTEGNADLIAEIEGGIKKEVSVGCAVERALCSICGSDFHREPCQHRKGQSYDGRLCYASLEGASDAYEFSFVAVPAQPAAGIVKGLSAGCATLKELVRQNPGCADELIELEQQAELGRKWERELKQEMVRLALLSGSDLSRETLEGMAEKANHQELMDMKRAYEKRAAARYPIHPQLEYEEKLPLHDEKDRAFLI